MNTKEYTNNAKRTRPDLGSSFNDQLHMALGISTEANELLDIYKKKFAYGKEIDYINLAEEIGDLFWYIFNMIDLCGFSAEGIMITNINKLKERYPEKFTQYNALNRNLDKERKILESLGFESEPE